MLIRKIKRFVGFFVIAFFIATLFSSIFSSYQPNRTVSAAAAPPCNPAIISTCSGGCTEGNAWPTVTVDDNVTIDDSTGAVVAAANDTNSPTNDELFLIDTAGGAQTLIAQEPTGNPTYNGSVASYVARFPVQCLSAQEFKDAQAGDFEIFSSLTGAEDTPITTPDTLPAIPDIATQTLSGSYTSTSTFDFLTDSYTRNPYLGCYDLTATSVPCPTNTNDTLGDPITGNTMCYLEVQAEEGEGWENVSCITLTPQGTIPAAIAAAVVSGQQGPSPSGQVTNTATTCESSGISLTWILCPIFNMVSTFSQWALNDIVQPFLAVSPVSTSPANGSYQVWSQFRVYGNIVLVIGLLILIFAEIFGGGIIDAYTIKKVLPRILVAVILINLSIYVVAALIDISNVVGGSIANLLLEPYKTSGALNFSLNGGQQFGIFSVGIMGAIIGGAGLSGLIFGLMAGSFIGIAVEAAFFLILPVLLGAVAVFFTLIARQGIILFLIIISPIAFALYCLPNTEQYFKQWWKLLMECLLVYPIVMIIFAVSDILSMTILQANSVTINTGGFVVSGVRETLAAVIAFILQFVPLFAAPFAFRIAGGTLGQMNQLFHNVGKNINKMADSRRQQVNQRYNSQALSGRNRALKRLTAVGDKPIPEDATAVRKVGARLKKIGAGALASRVSGYNMAAAMSAEQARVGKEVNDQIATGEDAEVRGLSVNKKEALKHEEGTEWRYNKDADGNILSRQFKTLGGGWVNESDVDAGHSRWGGNQFAQQAALSYEMRKAQTDDDRAHLAENYDQVALKSWGMTGDQANGVWTGASFENQNNNLQFKYIKRNGPVDKQTGVRAPEFDSAGYVNEVYEKRGTYPMSQMDATSINRLTDAYTEIDALGDQATQQQLETKQKLQTIAGSMSGRMGATSGGAPQIITEGDQQSVAPGGATGAAGHVAQAIETFVNTATPTRPPRNRGDGSAPTGPTGGGDIPPESPPPIITRSMLRGGGPSSSSGGSAQSVEPSNDEGLLTVDRGPAPEVIEPRRVVHSPGIIEPSGFSENTSPISTPPQETVEVRPSVEASSLSPKSTGEPPAGNSSYNNPIINTTETDTDPSTVKINYSDASADPGQNTTATRTFGLNSASPPAASGLSQNSRSNETSATTSETPSSGSDSDSDDVPPSEPPSGP